MINTDSLRPSVLNYFSDRLTRGLAALFFTTILVLKCADLVVFCRNVAQRNELGAVAFYVEITARTSVIFFIALISFLFLWRLKPLGKARGVLSRITALAGTFLVVAFSFLPRAELSITASILATAVMIFGNISSVYVLARLGRSFSIMAEARKLVTSGPYAVVRHPLYLTEEIALLGAVMHYLSIYAVLVFVLHLFIQIQRMKNEEAILLDVYPEYADYQATKARLIPHVY